MQETLPWNKEHVHYWSDGPASQFKNRFTINILLHHEEDYGSTADWSFFATAHGKGPIDGIDGKVKRQVCRAVPQGKEVVANAETFAYVAEQHSPRITVLCHSADSVRGATEHLPERWENCQPLHGTQRYHFLNATDSSTIAYGKNSIFTDPSRVLANKEMRPVPTANAAAPAVVTVSQNAAAVEANSLAPNEPQPPQCNPGDFVYVKLVTGRNTGLFVAQVSSILPDGIDVVFLRKSGSNGQTFVFPVIEYRAVILVDEILEVLPFPRLDKRSRYIFTEKIKVTS